MPNERLNDKCVARSARQGVGLLSFGGVWGGGQKAGNLIQVKGIMEKKQYDSILKIQAIPSGLRIIHLFQIMSKLPPVKKINIF